MSITATITNEDGLFAELPYAEHHVNMTTAVAVSRGDLLVIDAANVATLAADHTAWNAVALNSYTAAEATAQAAASVKMPVVVTADGININAIKLAGVAVLPAQFEAARARGVAVNITLK